MAKICFLRIPDLQSTAPAWTADLANTDEAAAEVGDDDDGDELAGTSLDNSFCLKTNSQLAAGKPLTAHVKKSRERNSNLNVTNQWLKIDWPNRV